MRGMKVDNILQVGAKPTSCTFMLAMLYHQATAAAVNPSKGLGGLPMLP